MDKRIILAVAGSGKTRHIIESLDLERRSLIVTYTNNNFYNIKSRIIQKFGFFPDNIYLVSYFSFLYSFCFKPFLLNKTRAKGIRFDPCANRVARGDQRYIDGNNRVYSNRLTKFIIEKGEAESVSARISRYFDAVFFDEIQDIAGNDFNFLHYIVNAECDVLFVGDFYQHTFDTSRDGNTNASLHKQLDGYLKKVKDMGLVIDADTLDSSYRCGPSVCKFVEDNLGIAIRSKREDDAEILEVDDSAIIKEIFEDGDIVKLFYQSRTTYPCFGRNWGESKGEDRYNDVCVVLNKNTYKLFSEKNMRSLNPTTRNKLYVAITRARGRLIFVSEEQLKSTLKS
jgi:DNA helicase-2/ATP-dependent DNA helicase PcrA